jgi:transposase-like protein
MRERRRFSAAFKQQVIGELLNGVCTLAQLSRRYDVSPGLILYWKKRSEGGGLVEEPGRSEMSMWRALRSWSGWWES